MVLMMVIGVVIFALTLSTVMTDLGLSAKHYSDYVQNRENNYLIARSAIEMGITLLSNDTGDTDSLQDYWAKGEISLQWEGHPVTLRIVDEESKFPLSAMQASPDDSYYLEQALARFMENANIREGTAAVDQFLDWVDPDGIRRSQGAEESDYDGKRRFKDGPCHSLHEVLALPAWSGLPQFPAPRKSITMDDVNAYAASSATSEVSADINGTEEKNTDSKDLATRTEGKFANDGKGKSKFSGGSFNNDVPEGSDANNVSQHSQWSEWMTVMSTGKININTAPVQVLRCLDEKMTETLVNEIDDKRRSTAFKNIDELRDITGFDEDLRYRLKNYLCCKSSVFELRSVVRSAPGTITITAFVNRDSGNKVMRWEVR